MYHAVTVVASWSLKRGGLVAVSSPFTVTNIFDTEFAEFSETI